MSGLLWGLAIVSTAVALYAVGRAIKLRAEVERLKREQYYTGNQLKRLPDEIRQAVEPLRVQVAAMASGASVSKELILNGQLYHDVSAAEAQRLVEDQRGRTPDTVVILDVRTPKEYAIKRVSGAKLVPFEELETRYKTEIPDDAEKVFVYCASGERSRLACDFLSRRGYTNLYYMRDGLHGWRGPTEGEGKVTLVQIERRSSPDAAQAARAGS